MAINTNVTDAQGNPIYGSSGWQGAVEGDTSERQARTSYDQTPVTINGQTYWQAGNLGNLDAINLDQFGGGLQYDPTYGWVVPDATYQAYSEYMRQQAGSGWEGLTNYVIPMLLAAGGGSLLSGALEGGLVAGAGDAALAGGAAADTLATGAAAGGAVAGGGTSLLGQIAASVGLTEAQLQTAISIGRWGLTAAQVAQNIASGNVGVGTILNAVNLVDGVTSGGDGGTYEGESGGDGNYTTGGDGTYQDEGYDPGPRGGVIDLQNEIANQMRDGQTYEGSQDDPYRPGMTGTGGEYEDGGQYDSQGRPIDAEGNVVDLSSSSGWNIGAKGITIPGWGTVPWSDVGRVLGTAGATILGYMGASNQAESNERMFNQYLGLGAPARARLEGSYAPGFSMLNEPGYKDALDLSTNTFLRAASAGRAPGVSGGNPFDNPGAWAETMKYVTGSTALPALHNYRAQNITAGGLGVGQSVPFAAGIGDANAGQYRALGFGLDSLLNPPQQNSITYDPATQRYVINVGKPGQGFS